MSGLLLCEPTPLPRHTLCCLMMSLILTLWPHETTKIFTGFSVGPQQPCACAKPRFSDSCPRSKGTNTLREKAVMDAQFTSPLWLALQSLGPSNSGCFSSSLMALNILLFAYFVLIVLSGNVVML